MRENALDLYGFATKEEWNFFELLLTVSGIGPKSAMAILSVASPATIKQAIVTDDSSRLTKVSGIGKKTAEKIVLELKDKVGIGSIESTRALSSDEGALEAMRSLGYSQSEAREALRAVPSEFQGVNDRLREALRILGSRSK